MLVKSHQSHEAARTTTHQRNFGIVLESLGSDRDLWERLLSVPGLGGMKVRKTKKNHLHARDPRQGISFWTSQLEHSSWTSSGVPRGLTQDSKVEWSVSCLSRPMHPA